MPPSSHRSCGFFISSGGPVWLNDISHDKTHARGGFFKMEPSFLTDGTYTHFIVGCTRSQCFQSETRFKHYDLLGYHNWASFLVRDSSWRHLRPYLGRLGIICIEVAGYENRVSADIIRVQLSPMREWNQNSQSRTWFTSDGCQGETNVK